MSLDELVEKFLQATGRERKELLKQQPRSPPRTGSSLENGSYLAGWKSERGRSRHRIAGEAPDARSIRGPAARSESGEDKTVEGSLRQDQPPRFVVTGVAGRERRLRQLVLLPVRAFVQPFTVIAVDQLHRFDIRSSDHLDLVPDHFPGVATWLGEFHRW